MQINLFIKNFKKERQKGRKNCQRADVTVSLAYLVLPGDRDNKKQATNKKSEDTKRDFF